MELITVIGVTRPTGVNISLFITLIPLFPLHFQNPEVENLVNMFPNFEADVVYELYAACDGDMDRAVNSLLSMGA